MSPEASTVTGKGEEPRFEITKCGRGHGRLKSRSLSRRGSCYPDPATFCDAVTRAQLLDLSIFPQKPEKIIFKNVKYSNV